MSTSRDAILSRIRSARSSAVDAAPMSLPAIRTTGDAAAAALLDLFVVQARAYKVTVETCRRGEIPMVAARLMRDAGCGSLLVPPGFPTDALPHGATLVHDDGMLDSAAIAACDGVVTTCTCAIAQTGTLVLDHGEGQGRRTLTLLPDFHICLLDASQIVGLVPEAVARLEASVRHGRPLTFISGPSATSDIELNRVEGVHGPRRLAILCVVNGV